MTQDRGLGLRSWLSGPRTERAKIEDKLESHILPARHRVAVLPFANMSPDPDDEYFADGITEEIISTLCKIPQIEVISRTSIMQYKKTPKPVREVSRELNVGTIIEGSVRKTGNKLRITVKMIDTSKDRHEWAESYDRELQDIFGVQSDIANKVADSTKTSLLGGLKTQLDKVPTRNRRAYENYLRGNYLAQEDAENKRSSAIDSIKCLEKAIKEDPEFSAAYAALGNAYVLFAGEHISSKEAFEKAEPLIAKALELDENSSLAHLAKGNLAMQFQLDLGLAEREFKRAIDLNPSSAQAHSWYSVLLRARGALDAALAEAWRAHELDPLSIWARGQLVECFVMKHDWINAIALAEEMARAKPESSALRLFLARALFRAERLNEAQKELETAQRLKVTSDDKIDLARTLALFGSYADARSLLLEIEGERQKQIFSLTRLATAYSLLGEKEKALELLEEDFENDKFAFLLNYTRPDLDPIRELPRFQSLLAKLASQGKITARN